MSLVPVKKLHRIEVTGKKGKPVVTTLELKYHRITLLPLLGNQKKYPSLTLTMIHAQEHNKPDNREPIDWKLITNLPIIDDEHSIEKLNCYALRWKIETFHKI
jgi:hypothetical protein